MYIYIRIYISIYIRIYIRIEREGGRRGGKHQMRVELVLAKPRGMLLQHE